MKARELARLRSLIKGTGPETDISIRDLLDFPGASLVMAAVMAAAFLA